MAGGGIGEAALIGAALGGGASVLQGGDPLKGALMGGLMGGIGGGLLPGAGAGAAGTGTGAGAGAAGGLESIMGQQAAQAATQQALTNQGMLQSGLDLGGIGASPATMGAAQQAAPTGIASLMPQTLGGKILAGTAGIGALGMLSDRNKFGMPEQEEYSGPLSKFRYDPGSYTPYTYRPYAGGGPVEAMSNANAVGQNTGFPMADISRGAYATPYQQPISQNVLSGPQDTAVDMYTGQERLASGGIASLGGYSDGGRLLKGPGDGVSDSIPATIGNRQPARLADGEFVVPARIVSELGNGSTDAGARELYKMMDRVQSARRKTTGKGKMAKNTRASKYLPA